MQPYGNKITFLHFPIRTSPSFSSEAVPKRVIWAHRGPMWIQRALIGASVTMTSTATLSLTRIKAQEPGQSAEVLIL